MLQKVIKVGNSAAVTIPKDFLHLANISIGSDVVLKTEPEKRRVIIEFLEKPKIKTEMFDKEVYKVAKDLLRRYLPAFKELAKK
ncbi:MAG: AbrB/MazE/SpoVT family DNA-binding domain-containing protein [bacterium]|nr:AbrB/MazE/SpoVT family DNA-binding domain-containing protein [bacterium]